MTATSSRRTAGVTTATQIGLSLVGAVTGITLARLLGPESRGELAAIQLWGSFLAWFAALGVQDAVVYVIAKSRDEAGTYLASAIALISLTSAGFMAVGWFLLPVVLGDQNRQTLDLARVFLLTIPLYVIGLMAINALRGLALFERWNVVRCLAPLGWFVVIVVARLTDHVTVSFLTIGYIVDLVAVLVIALVLAGVTVRGPFTVDRGRWSPLVRFGLPGVLSSVPQLLNLRVDQLFLLRYVSREQLGFYVAAVAWASVTAPVLAALGSILFPRLAGELDDERRAAMLARGIRYAVLLCLGLGTVVLLATPLGMRVLFGDDFAAGVPAGAILVVAGCILALNGVVEEGLRGLGRPKEVLYAECGGLAVTTVMLLALMRPFGITGAAIASLGGYGGTAVFLLLRLRHVGTVARWGDLVPGMVDGRELLTLVMHRRGADGAT
jgi:O-antigen/teichoic acid export membrane protein